MDPRSFLLGSAAAAVAASPLAAAIEATLSPLEFDIIAASSIEPPLGLPTTQIPILYVGPGQQFATFQAAMDHAKAVFKAAPQVEIRITAGTHFMDPMAIERAGMHIVGGYDPVMTVAEETNWAQRRGQIADPLAGSPMKRLMSSVAPAPPAVRATNFTLQHSPWTRTAAGPSLERTR